MNVLYPTGNMAEVYAATDAELLALSTAGFSAGSKAYVVQTAQLYVLDAEGGSWYDTDGNQLTAAE